jgi:hypothetical protein
VTTEICPHCHFGIPSDATTCPGCGRRHQPPFDTSDLPRHSHLFRVARWSRRLLVLAGWVSVAFGVTSLSRYVVGLDRVASRLSDDIPRRVTDVTRDLGWATVAALAAVGAATWTWARLAHRNLRPLHLDTTWWSPWSLPGWLVPGRAAALRKAHVDACWRGDSPMLAALPTGGHTRRPVSQVVLRWWSLWLWAPAAIAVLVVVVDAQGDPSTALTGLSPLFGVAAAGLLVASLRSLYDVVGILTTVQAHRADELLHPRPDYSHLPGRGDGASSSSASASGGVAATA